MWEEFLLSQFPDDYGSRVHITWDPVQLGHCGAQSDLFSCGDRVLCAIQQIVHPPSLSPTSATSVLQRRKLLRAMLLRDTYVRCRYEEAASYDKAASSSDAGTAATTASRSATVAVSPFGAAAGHAETTTADSVAAVGTLQRHTHAPADSRPLSTEGRTVRKRKTQRGTLRRLCEGALCGSNTCEGCGWVGFSCSG